MRLSIHFCLLLLASLAILTISCTKKRYHYLSDSDKTFLTIPVGDSTKIISTYSGDTNYCVVQSEHGYFEKIRTKGFADIPKNEYLETITRYNDFGYIRIQKNKNDEISFEVLFVFYRYTDLVANDVTLELDGRTYKDVYVLKWESYILYVSKEYGFVLNEDVFGKVLFKIDL